MLPVHTIINLKKMIMKGNQYFFQTEPMKWKYEVLFFNSKFTKFVLCLLFIDRYICSRFYA